MTPEEMFGTVNIGDAVKTVREDVFKHRKTIQ